jgi:hypothetical protein
VALKSKGTYQFLTYAHAVILLDTINKNRETLTEANKEDDLEINLKRNRYMLLSCHQNAGQNCDIKTGNKLSDICHSQNIWEQQ